MTQNEGGHLSPSFALVGDFRRRPEGERVRRSRLFRGRSWAYDTSNPVWVVSVLLRDGAPRYGLFRQREKAFRTDAAYAPYC